MRATITYIWSRESKILSCWNLIMHGFLDEELNLFWAWKLPYPIPQRFINGHSLCLKKIL